jgi:glycerol-3-phosphate acyltransferase PlsY
LVTVPERSGKMHALKIINLILNILLVASGFTMIFLGYNKWTRYKEIYCLIFSFLFAAIMFIYCLQWIYGIQKYAFASMIVMGLIALYWYRRANLYKINQKQNQAAPPPN